LFSHLAICRGYDTIYARSRFDDRAKTVFQKKAALKNPSWDERLFVNTETVGNKTVTVFGC